MDILPDEDHHCLQATLHSNHHRNMNLYIPGPVLVDFQAALALLDTQVDSLPPLTLAILHDLHRSLETTPLIMAMAVHRLAVNHPWALLVDGFPHSLPKQLLLALQGT